jgi:hypothetical protein
MLALLASCRIQVAPHYALTPNLGELPHSYTEQNPERLPKNVKGCYCMRVNLISWKGKLQGLEQ